MFKYSLLCLVCFSLSQGVIAQCDNATQHSNMWNDAWLSCEMSPNPNTERGIGHWIQYDFGSNYQFNESHFWNSNEAGYTHRGFQEVAIDYSEDGSNWTELGIFEFEEATGTNDYEGFAGPDFGGIQARYILITMRSTFDESDCTGLAEVKFYVNEITETTSIETITAEEEQTNRFQIFPNPVENIINLQTSHQWVSYKITNELGQVVIIGNFMTESFSTEINVSELPRGVYSISLEDKDEGIETQQFIKIDK